MACSSCRLAKVWLLLLVFLLAAANGASFAAYPRTQGEEEIKKAIAVPAGQKDASNNGSSPSPPPSPAGNKQSSGEKEKDAGKKEGCVTAKECHMKRLVCAKKCTLAAHNKCAAKCSSACSSSLLHLPFP